MIQCNDLRILVIRPTLQYLQIWSQFYENLLLGTAAHESQLGTYLKQIGEGPALGIYQMEPATHEDIWRNYLFPSRSITAAIKSLKGASTITLIPVITNLGYATAMAAMSYYRHNIADLDDDDIDGMANYWKKYYNSINGQGTIQQFKDDYARYITKSNL